MTDPAAAPTPGDVAGEPYTSDQLRITDRCPSCGWRSLFIGAGGWLTCSVLDCKHPAHSDAITEAVRAAVAAEAERCAKIAEARIAQCQHDNADCWTYVSKGVAKHLNGCSRCWEAAEIAAAIRGVSASGERA